MRISDWSSDVCSSDLLEHQAPSREPVGARDGLQRLAHHGLVQRGLLGGEADHVVGLGLGRQVRCDARVDLAATQEERAHERGEGRSEEHTSELQSLMRISYAVFCLKKKQSRKNKLSDRHG